MDQFYKDLVEKIRDAAEKDIQKIIGETGGEKIYVAALVTDSFIIQSRPSPPGRPQRQSIMRLCGIRCKDYICISSPFAVPDFPDTIDVMLSSAKISSRTPAGIGLPCVHPGTFSFTALATFLPMLISNCCNVHDAAERSPTFSVL